MGPSQFHMRRPLRNSASGHFQYILNGFSQPLLLLSMGCMRPYCTLAYSRACTTCTAFSAAPVQVCLFSLLHTHEWHAGPGPTPDGIKFSSQRSTLPASVFAFSGGRQVDILGHHLSIPQCNFAVARHTPQHSVPPHASRRDHELQIPRSSHGARYAAPCALLRVAKHRALLRE